MGRDETPITLAGRTIGVGLCVSALLLPTLRDGGLAPLAVAAATAAVIGVPAAQAEWRAGPAEGSPWVDVAGRTAHVAGMLWVAAVAAPLVRAAGVGGAAMCVAGWTAALVLGSRSRLTFGIALALLAIAAARAVVGFALSPVATLLSPLWATWSEWLGPALLAGVLAGGAGLGPWTVGPRRVPGHDETPWAAAGAALLLVTLLSVQAGARFEATLGATFSDPGRDALVAGGALLGAAVVVGPRAGSRSGAPVRAAFGAATTTWLAWPGLEAVPLVLGGVVPCLAAIVLFQVAWRHRSAASRAVAGWGALAPWIASVAIVAVVLVATPPVQMSVGAGAAAAILLSIAFWIVATRSLLAPRESA